MSKAIVVKIDKIEPIKSADRIQVGYVLGEAVVVSKEMSEGDIGIYFPPDLQLCEEFCRENNLHRQSRLNKDIDKSGFFGDNRRVRCQPFMKVKSNGFFAKTEMFSYLGPIEFKLGESFDTLKGKQVCKKYLSDKTIKAMQKLDSKKKTHKIGVPLFHKHVDTEQFAYYGENILKGALISIHSKYHGTSARYSYTKVFRDLPRWKKWCNKVVSVFPEYTWDFVAGTRNVILYETEENRQKESYHGIEQYRFDILELLKPFLEKGMTVYGEIVGYANGRPIMGVHNTKALKDKKFTKKYGEEVVYKYGCRQDQCRFIIYRISYTNEDGTEMDMSVPQLVSWCKQRGLEHTLQVTKPLIYHGDIESLSEMVCILTEREDVLTQDYDDPTHPSEGVVIRVDGAGTKPKFYKSKSYVFKVMEGIFKEDNIDLEDAS